jgi:hypothetical protein
MYHFGFTICNERFKSWLLRKLASDAKFDQGFDSRLAFGWLTPAPLLRSVPTDGMKSHLQDTASHSR